jgi:hypothetical protein
VHERLKRSGEVRGRTVSEEIRERLAGSLFEETRDEKTRQLAAEIVQLAEEIRRDFGITWHEHTGAFKAFAAAIADQIATYERSSMLQSPLVPILFGAAPNPDDPPEVIGRALARRYRREREALEKARAESRTKKGEQR